MKLKTKNTLKKVISSRTVILAVLQGLIGLAIAVGTEVPELDLAGLVVVLKSVVDIILRLDTTKRLV